MRENRAGARASPKEDVVGSAMFKRNIDQFRENLKSCITKTAIILQFWYNNVWSNA